MLSGDYSESFKDNVSYTKLCFWIGRLVDRQVDRSVDR